MGKPLILRNVGLDANVEKFVSELYEIITVDQLTDDNAKEIDVLLTNGGGKCPRELIERLPNLKLIDDFGVGYDGIDLAACKERGIVVCNTPGVLTEDVADLGMTMIFAVSRKITVADRLVKAGAWSNGKGDYGLGHKVSGKKVGIVGLGRIGQAVARRCEGFNMQLSYFDAYVNKPEYTKYDNLVEMAKNVDFMVLCAAANADNRGLISREVLEALGPQGTLVNVARGSLVDEDALVDCLKSGKLGYAGLDVFVAEPKVPEALYGMDNVVLSPHVASATVETRLEMANIVINNLKAFREGTPYVTQLKF